MTGDPLVVLLEDDESLRNALRLALGSHGFRVAAAATADEAVTLLEEAPPQALVADLSLPDGSGPELVSELRAAAPRARLVVLTGHEGEALRRSCLEAGADDFVVKPTTGRELADLLAT